MCVIQKRIALHYYCSLLHNKLDYLYTIPIGSLGKARILMFSKLLQQIWISGKMAHSFVHKVMNMIMS